MPERQASAKDQTQGKAAREIGAKLRLPERLVQETRDKLRLQRSIKEASAKVKTAGEAISKLYISESLFATNKRTTLMAPCICFMKSWLTNEDH